MDRDENNVAWVLLAGKTQAEASTSVPHRERRR